jgi:uncharacterized membrane protein YphA (DoxX/SURF4 family)
MNIGLWVAQGFLAFAFIAVGSMKLFSYDKMKVQSEREGKPPLSRGLAGFIGSCEVAGGLGVVLPMLTGVLPQLTPIAATALALVMVLAVWHHVLRKDSLGKSIPATVLFGVAIFVAYGRGRGMIG